MDTKDATAGSSPVQDQLQIGSIAAGVLLGMGTLTVWALSERTKALASTVAERLAKTQAAQREQDALLAARAESKAKREAQAERACIRAAETAAILSNYIRLLGYEARGHSPLDHLGANTAGTTFTDHDAGGRDARNQQLRPVERRQHDEG